MGASTLKTEELDETSIKNIKWKLHHTHHNYSSPNFKQVPDYFHNKGTIM